MKNKHSKAKLLLVLISAIMLFSVFSLSAFATNEDEPKDGIMEWILSEDGIYLYDDDTVYKQINIPTGYYVDFSSEYIYAYEIESDLFDSGICYPVSPQKNSEVVCLVDYYDDYFYMYATDAEKASLKKFFGKDISKFRIQAPNDSMEYADISDSLIADLNSAADSLINGKTFDVTELENNIYVEFVGRNESDYMGMIYGAIYLIDGNYYYLNYSNLSNGYFDANGDFSYRQGTVSLTKIDGTLLTQIQNRERNMTRHSYESEYEEDEIDFIFDEATSKVIFWITFAFFGFLVPIAPLVVGFSFARSVKRGYPKHWYLVALLSLAWMALSLILAIILIFG